MGFSLGGKSAKSYIAVDLKVVDTETSEIIDTRTIEGTSESTSRAFSGNLFGIGDNAEQKKKAPVGKAIRAAVINTAEYLECSMVDKDQCIEKFNKKEERRRERTKSELSLDE
ncbi:MAG TPA: CsgG/HfaB family protein [Alphaproteobacteria bacterium]|nr:CsgG/HfaB family protein [Alphaproteobacteria bacterium]